LGLHTSISGEHSACPFSPAPSNVHVLYSIISPINSTKTFILYYISDHNLKIALVLQIIECYTSSHDSYAWQATVHTMLIRLVSFCRQYPSKWRDVAQNMLFITNFINDEWTTQNLVIVLQFRGASCGNESIGPKTDNSMVCLWNYCSSMSR
jgi:hypothetical protein